MLTSKNKIAIKQFYFYCELQDFIKDEIRRVQVLFEVK